MKLNHREFFDDELTPHQRVQPIRRKRPKTGDVNPADARRKAASGSNSRNAEMRKRNAEY